MSLKSPTSPKPSDLRVFPVLVSREWDREPLRVPICIFEADPLAAYFKAHRQAQLFYGFRFLGFAA